MLDMDGDPTPGDPSRVKALSIQLHEFADDVESALRLVRGMQSEQAILSWAGLSADAFRDEFGSTPKNLDKLHTSYRMAADAWSRTGLTWSTRSTRRTARSWTAVPPTADWPGPRRI
ncbi:hypothetical protein [Streptomyces sp.]|uniref:hypothetical protein n=1 Tax=Streptomyces sp. TaxID=1931 RepID=UPI002F407A86